MKNLIRCFECDSEYYIEYTPGLLADEIQFCAICNEPLDSIESVDDQD